MDFIDIHTHIYPEKIAKKAADAICSYYHLTEGMTGTSELLLEREKEAGISKAVLLPVATKASLRLRPSMLRWKILLRRPRIF